MSNVLKSGGLRTMGTPMLGAANPNATGESDEETGVIDVLDLEQGKAHSTVKLGRQGENNSQTVQFDCSTWLADFGEAEVSIVARRPGENNTYLVSGVSYADGTLTWTIATEDTDRAGCGEAEIRAVSGEKVKKSARFRTKIEKSVEDYTGGVVTPPYWAVDIISQAQTASEDAAAAARNSGIASSMATSAESAASDSEGSARRAEAAATEAAASAEAAAESAAIAELYAYNQRVNAQMAPQGLTSVLTEMEPGYIGSDGANTSGASSRRVKDYIPVQPNSRIYVRSDGAHNVYVRLYDTGKTYLRSVSVLTTTAEQKKKQAIGADVAYIRPTIQSVGEDGDVYAIDWAVCSGAGPVSLQAGTDILTLPVGEYISTSTITPTLINCPVTTGSCRMSVFERTSSELSAFIYTASDIYLKFTLSGTGAWYKFTGTAV